MTDAAARHVVVVDDDTVISGLIAEVLQDDGCQVTTFDSGESLLSGLDQIEGSVQVLVVDVRLGHGMDGFETSRHARKRWPDLPVVFISGDLRPLVRSSGPKDLCLMKPFTAAGLRKVLEAAQV